MKTLTLDVRPLAGSLEDFARVWKTGRADPRPRISFATPELLWQLLTARRWDSLKAIAGRGLMTVDQAARRLGDDAGSVHEDTVALVNAGLLSQAEDGRIEFPFDAVHVDFVLRAA